MKINSNFLPNPVRPQFFAWQTKFAEIDPLWVKQA
jgi:hypothetical protein